MVRDLYATDCQIDQAGGSGGKCRIFRSMVQFALAKRHEALAACANSRQDCLWNTASLIESIATVELKLGRLDARGGADEVREQVGSLISRYLSDDARAEIDALHIV